ncbi:hypothetical protein [Demequina sp. NBRC 110055]|uniref:hypothetical protein n=1 Tax=Demequina sp. NBRC 110055 TaxID=1570344 RepID=UPI000A058BD2|nr:hypothetical protein [Demequina sp. NBRC 110055]
MGALLFGAAALDVIPPPLVPSPATTAVPETPDLEWVFTVGGCIAGAGALLLLFGIFIKPLRRWSGNWIWLPLVILGFFVLMIPPVAEIPHKVLISKAWEAQADEVLQYNRVGDETARVYGRDPDGAVVYWSFGDQDVILDINEESEVVCDSTWDDGEDSTWRDDWPTGVTCPLPRVAPAPDADAAVLPALAQGVVVPPREDPDLRAPSTWDRWALAWLALAALGTVWMLWSIGALLWYFKIKRWRSPETGKQVFSMGFATTGVIAGTLIAMWAGFTGVILLQDMAQSDHSVRDGYERLLLRIRGVDPDDSYEMAWTRQNDDTASAWVDEVKADAGVWLSYVPRGTQFDGGYDTPGVLLTGTAVDCHVDDAPGWSNDWIVTCARSGDG